MAVTIGHARGGDPTYTPGDQSGHEVRTQPWYSNGWDFVLRFRDSAMAERAARACEAACANDNIGYSQTRRNDLRAAAKAVGWDFARITSPADCDCSSLMSVCAEAAGVNMSITYSGGNAPWTGNMREKFSLTGAFEVLTNDRYLKTDAYLRRGDILVNEITHTCMALTNGENAYAGASAASGGTYTVQEGDTLWYIASKHKVTLDALCEVNGLDPAKFIYPGQKLVMPG